MKGWLECPSCGGTGGANNWCHERWPADAVATLPWRLHVEPQRAGVHTQTLTGAAHYDGPYVAIVGANGIVVADNAEFYAEGVTQVHAQMIVAAVNAKGAQP